MGRSKHKKQVVIYLPPDLHQTLRVQAAHTGKTISELVEVAIRAHAGSPQRIPLPVGLEEAKVEVIDALAQHGAPLWSSGRPTRLSLEEAVAQGLAAARTHASLLHVLPIVLYNNRSQLSWPELRAQVGTLALPALGMLLDLTAEVTGTETFRTWAAELREAGVRQEPAVSFFAARSSSTRYLELAQQRTPEAVRRWGFLMATPIEDFRAAVRRYCQDEQSSTART